MTKPKQVSANVLIERYDAFLLDAYGVLVDRSGARPGAADFLRALNTANKPWLVVTNDASRRPQTAARWYRSLGLPVDDERVLTSGSLISLSFAEHQLQGQQTLVFGGSDAQQMATEAGAHVIPEDAPEDTRVDVILVCDESGFPLLPFIDRALSALILGHEQGPPPRCFLANPDRIYPAGSGRYGMAAGSIATVLTEGLRVRHPGAPDPFIRLGKPHRPIFDAALSRVGTRRALMVGDTLHTDIRGALDAGLDAALIDPDPTRWANRTAPDVTPTWLLSGLHTVSE